LPLKFPNYEKAPNLMAWRRNLSEESVISLCSSALSISLVSIQLALAAGKNAIILSFIDYLALTSICLYQWRELGIFEL
jgi:hypothetical protein